MTNCTRCKKSYPIKNFKKGNATLKTCINCRTKAIKKPNKFEEPVEDEPEENNWKRPVDEESEDNSGSESSDSDDPNGIYCECCDMNFDSQEKALKHANSSAHKRLYRG